MSCFSSELALIFTIALYIIFLLMLLFSCGYSFYFYAKNIIIDTSTVIRIVHIVNINGFCYIFLLYFPCFPTNIQIANNPVITNYRIISINMT